MRLRLLAFIPLLTFAALPGLVADTPQLGVDEIRPGMIGLGRTVFDGTRVEEFKVNILGVLANVIGPHRNLILAKLEGGPLANRPGDAQLVGVSGISGMGGDQLGSLLRPIATPLVMSGFEPEVADTL